MPIPALAAEAQERGSGRGAPPSAAHPAARARARARSARPNASRTATTRAGQEIPDAPKPAGAARSSAMQETPLQPIVYSLQFRGPDHIALRPECSSNAQARRARVLITTVDANGLAGRRPAGRGRRKRCSYSRLVLADDGSFDQSGTIEFAARPRTGASAASARLGSAPPPDPHLRHGAAVWEVEGGEGQFHGARGRITSNFFVSDTNELTDNHFGLIFVAPRRGNPPYRSKNPRLASDAWASARPGPSSVARPASRTSCAECALWTAPWAGFPPYQDRDCAENSPWTRRYGATSRSTTNPVARRRWLLSQAIEVVGSRKERTQ